MAGADAASGTAAAATAAGRGEGQDKTRLRLPASCGPPSETGSDKPAVWIIFGATGHMGRSLVKAALLHGDTVTAVGRTFENTPEQMSGWHERCLGLLCDVRVRETVDDAVKRSIKHWGRVDVIANCTGYGVVAAAEDQSEHDVYNQYSTNFLGTLHIIQSSLPYFRTNGVAGRYLIFSSTAGALGVPGLAPFAASKYAVEGLVESMLYETDCYDIKATLVEPGYVRQDDKDASRAPSPLFASVQPHASAQSVVPPPPPSSSATTDPAASNAAAAASDLTTLSTPPIPYPTAVETALTQVPSPPLHARSTRPQPRPPPTTQSHHLKRYGHFVIKPPTVAHTPQVQDSSAYPPSQHHPQQQHQHHPRQHQDSQPTSSPYAYPTSPALHSQRIFAWLDARQPTSAVRSAELVWQLGRCRHPPLRLLLGAYAVESIRDRLRCVIEEIEDWKHLSFEGPLGEEGPGWVGSEEGLGGSGGGAGGGGGYGVGGGYEGSEAEKERREEEEEGEESLDEAEGEGEDEGEGHDDGEGDGDGDGDEAMDDA